MQKTRILLAARLLGVIPLLLFIAWIQGNMTLPGEIQRPLMEKFSWPWLPLQQSSAAVRIGADVLLLVLAGMLLQFGGKRLQGFARMPLFGIVLFCVMSSWQYTGHIFWAIPVPLIFTQVVSPILYYGFVIAAFIFTGPFNALTRESIFLLTLAALLTPFMSLDRLIVITFIGVLMYFKYVTRKVKA